MEISQRIQKLTQDFKSCADWEERYLKMIEYGKNLPPLPSEAHQENFKIKGCQSQVWLYPHLGGETLRFSADSDAALVKGIIALLLYVYSDSSADDILTTKDSFLKEIGITEHLSMNRSNGLRAMLKQIKLYAIAFKTMKNKESK